MFGTILPHFAANSDQLEGTILSRIGRILPIAAACHDRRNRHGNQRSATTRANAPNRVCAATIRPAAPISPLSRPMTTPMPSRRSGALLSDRQTKLTERLAHKSYLDGVAALGLIDRIPDFGEVSEKLRKLTGWEIVAVPGLIPAGPFFDHLANRRFPVTNWLRTERRARLHRRARHVPRFLRPRAGADPAGLCRFHADVRPESRRRNRAGRRRHDHAALLVHRRVRADAGAGRAAEGVRRRADVVLHRTAVRRRRPGRASCRRSTSKR